MTTQAQWEYRFRKVGSKVHILRVKGLLNTDQFTFECGVLAFKEWARAYEQNNSRGKPVFIPCPHVPFSRTVPMIRP